MKNDRWGVVLPVIKVLGLVSISALVFSLIVFGAPVQKLRIEIFATISFDPGDSSGDPAQGVQVCLTVDDDCFTTAENGHVQTKVEVSPGAYHVKAYKAGTVVGFIQLKRPDGSLCRFKPTTSVGDISLTFDASNSDPDSDYDYLLEVRMASKSSDQEIPCPEPPPPPVPTTTVKFSDASGKPLTGPTIDLAASKVYVSVMDDNHKGSGNIDNAVTVTLTRNGSVVKTTKVSVTETATKGTFLSDAITLGLADSGAMFEIAASDILKAEYVDPDDSSRINSDTKKVWALLASAFDCAGVQANINSGGKTTFKVLGIGIVNTQVMVYDITGKQVWRGSKASDTLEWNGMSANGARLANGVYLYVAICKGEKQSDIKTLGVKKLGILK